jgi:hypothetical protein
MNMMYKIIFLCGALGQLVLCGGHGWGDTSIAGELPLYFIMSCIISIILNFSVCFRLQNDLMGWISRLGFM